jgi:hypothetical protein
VKRVDGKVGGSGLCGIAERVEASGGDFGAGSLPGGGFGLRVNLPLVQNGTRGGDGQTPSATGARLDDAGGGP